MIFKPKLARAIVRGKKTQTRRRVKYEQVASRFDGPRDKRMLVACRYREGSDYALQTGRGKAAEPGIRLVVTEVRGPEAVGAITLEDAQAEGFRTRDDFFAYWRELYGDAADLHELVWVISFKPKREERFLATRPGEGEPMGQPDPQTGAATTDYVHAGAGALREAGQAVPEEYQAQLTAEGWERHAQDQPGLVERLEIVRAEARRKGVDVHRLEASIERRIRAYERRVRAAA